MANKLRRYWDSACCFGYLNDQAGRAKECERVIKEAEVGACEILVSAFTLAEVLYLKGPNGGAFPKESRDKIRNFFRRSYIVVADVDRFVSERAQDVFWDYNVKPKDAIHVATSLIHAAHYLETYDEPLIGLSRKLGGDPQLVVQLPGADLDAKQEAKQKGLIQPTLLDFDGTGQALNH